MSSSILLTGATGFLGRHLLAHLIQTDARIVVLGRASSRRENIAPFLPYITFLERESCELEEIFKRHRFDKILHCATNYGRLAGVPTDVIEVNLVWPLHLLQLAAKYEVAVFLNTDTILDKRINHYSLSKRQFGEWLGWFSPDLACINISLEHFYGPGDDPSKFATDIVRRLMAGEKTIELTPGAQKRDFIYIDDVVNALSKVLAWSEGCGHGAYEFQVGSGFPVSIREFVELAHGLVGCSATRLHFGALSYRPNEVMETRVDTRALQNLGWSAKVSLEEGLKHTIEAERARKR